jgi:hypothetical protein
MYDKMHSFPTWGKAGMGVLRVIRIDVHEFLKQEGHSAVN